jgi:hypothetical protein
LQELKTLMMSLRRTRPFLVKTPKLLWHGRRDGVDNWHDRYYLYS